MNLKYCILLLLSYFWQLISMSAAIQQDTSITDNCVRIELKSRKVIFAKINKQNNKKLTYTPCFPAGLASVNIDLDKVEKITDPQGAFLYNPATHGNLRNVQIATISAKIAICAAILAALTILFLVNSVSIHNRFIQVQVVMLSILGIFTGADALWRGRKSEIKQLYRILAFLSILICLTVMKRMFIP